MQYKTQYGTIFAVKEHNGAPAIMCRAEHSEAWSLSSMIEPYTPGAWTAGELQSYLDNWAATKGWKQVEEKDAAPPAADDGFPDWVQSMAAEFLQFDFVRGLPAFTATELKNSDPVRHNQGGSIADHGLYDTCPKGIKFTVLLSNRDLEKHYTWPDFVRRCKAAGLAPEPMHKDKEDAPCNAEQPAPTGDAAATTDGSAAVSTAETTTTSASGAGAKNCPADASTVPQPEGVCADIATTVPSSLPTFDYAGLDDQTVQDLHLAEREVAGGKRMAEMGLRRMADGVAIAHDALCGTDATFCRNGDGTFTAPEKTFGRWCESVGLNRKAAERLLQVSKLFDNSTPREQKVLEELGPSLLYAAAKPSAPPELVQAVKDRDITTAKEFRELEAELKAERAAREKAEKNAKAMKDGYSVAKKNEEFTLKNLKAAERERDEALKQRDGARDALQAAKLRGDKLKAENDALKAQPVEAKIIDEEEVDRRAKARAAELTAPLREELEALRNRHPADPEAAEQAIRDAYDSTIYTGRVIENAWHTLRPLLPCMDAERRDLAIRQLSKTIATIQGEIAACL